VELVLVLKVAFMDNLTLMQIDTTVSGLN